jgi:hypothetical protein
VPLGVGTLAALGRAGKRAHVGVPPVSGSTKLELQYLIVFAVRNPVVPPSVVNLGLAVASNCSAVYLLMAADTSGDDVLVAESEHATPARAVAATAIAFTG